MEEGSAEGWRISDDEGVCSQNMNPCSGNYT